MSYIEFLNWLRSIGPKLPDVMADINVIIERIQNIRKLLGFGELFGAAESASEEEAAAEQAVIARAMGGAETFGGPLQRLLDFIRNNQELIALLISLFGKK